MPVLEHDVTKAGEIFLSSSLLDFVNNPLNFFMTIFLFVFDLFLFQGLFPFPFPFLPPLFINTSVDDNCWNIFWLFKSRVKRLFLFPMQYNHNRNWRQYKHYSWGWRKKRSFFRTFIFLLVHKRDCEEVRKRKKFICSHHPIFGTIGCLLES